MSQSKFHDCFGRELEAQTCAYCRVTKPVAIWSGIENNKDVYNVLMVQYVGRDGAKAWKCKECSADIVNKSEGSIS